MKFIGYAAYRYFDSKIVDGYFRDIKKVSNKKKKNYYLVFEITKSIPCTTLYSFGKKKKRVNILVDMHYRQSSDLL